MHHEIMGYVGVDHKNHDTLNNRRGNLRKANSSQQKWNQGKRKNNTSGYKGVCWNKEKSKYQVQIGVNGKQIRLGYFTSAKKAARAYDKAARKYHGEFAVLNFQ
jgi:outer membrane usher protein FimD/PapC